MLDVELFGLRPGGHHAVSVLIHAASTVLLFLALRRMTGAIWRAALAAALFGVHPLRVESVLWIAERKDVLSTLFLVLTVLAYSRWVERRTAGSYAAIVVAFGLGLLAKPMLVTLPLLLLLLDFWPLERLQLASGRLRDRIVEKLPLFGMALVSAGLTLWAQYRGGAVKTLDDVSIVFRLANAVAATAGYLWKTVWPRGLAVFYPHPGAGIAPWSVALGAVVIVMVSLAVFRWRRHPWLLVGWFWYLIALVPVIGIIQVGNQAMADRYTYIPSIGLCVAAAWGYFTLTRNADPRRLIGYRIVPVFVVAALAVATYVQAGVWKNTGTLFQHALGVTSGNYVAHQYLGYLAVNRGEADLAERHFLTALEIQPDDALVRSNLGALYYSRDRLDEAVVQLEESLRLDPQSSSTCNNLGLALSALGRIVESVARFREALVLDPHNEAAHLNLGRLLSRLGRDAEAIPHLRSALDLEPEFIEAYTPLVTSLLRSGDPAAAREVAREGANRGWNPPAGLVRWLSAP
jgi:Flp pilus assembly protein TadD